METCGAAAEAEKMRFTTVADEQFAPRQATELVSAYVRQLPQDEPGPLAVQAPLVAPATGEDLGIPLLG